MKLKKILFITIIILSLVSAPNYGETLSLYSVSGNTYNDVEGVIEPIKSSYNCESIELENLNGDNVISNELTIEANLSVDKTSLNAYADIDAFLAILLYNTENDHLTSYEYGSINEDNKFLGSRYNKLTNARLKEEVGFSTLYPNNDLINLNYEIDKVYVLYSTTATSNPTETISPTETTTITLEKTTKTETTEMITPKPTATSSSKSESTTKNNIVLILVIAAAFIVFIILIAILLIIYFISKRNN
jgi:hypothetical protein